VSCNKNTWEIKEVIHESYYYYRIISAPEEYKDQINTSVCYYSGTGFEQDAFISPHKKEILKALNQGNYNRVYFGNNNYIFLTKPFLNDKLKLSNEKLTFIYKKLQMSYIGFDDMVKRGFTKDEFFKIQNFDELSRNLDKYVDDTHFNIMIGDLEYRQPTAHDEGCSRSKDPYDTYFEKETPNAYYIRFTNCTSHAYLENFASAAERALKKEYIVLDARSNFGGDTQPITFFQAKLARSEYGGTIYVLQDNWSFSAGELWGLLGDECFLQDYKLVGTHSGGMQTYCNNYPYKDDKLKIYMTLPANRMYYDLPLNYLGEGKGYEPEIWATTQNMKQILENFGVDLEDIIFQ